MYNIINRLHVWLKPPENIISLILFFFWFIGILIIWVPSFQIIFYSNNIIAYPSNLSIESIFTLFITLIAFLPAVTLTAVTIASASYGYKIIDFIRKGFYFWTLLISYLLIVILSLFFILFSINNSQLILSLQYSAIILLIFLIPFFISTFNNIELKQIVKKCSNLLNRKKYLPILFKYSDSFTPSEEDPSFYFRDLMIKSIQRKDFTGFKIVLDGYVKSVREIITDLKKNPQRCHPLKGITNEDKKIGIRLSQEMWTYDSIHFIGQNVFHNHFKIITEVAFHNQDEETLMEIVKATKSLGIETWKDIYRVVNATSRNR